jgi:hypothetical protein
MLPQLLLDLLTYIFLAHCIQQVFQAVIGKVCRPNRLACY